MDLYDKDYIMDVKHQVNEASYRLWFGQSTIYSVGNASTEKINKPEPMDIIIKANSQKQADEKARELAKTMHLQGTVCAKPI